MKKTLLGLALFTAFNANANIVNGDFESYDVATGAFVHITSTGNAWVPAAGEAWTPVPGSPLEFLEIRDNIVGTAQSGDQFAELVPNQASGIQQTFQVASTGAYDLNWYYAPRDELGSHNDYTVSLFEVANPTNVYSFSYDDAGTGSTGVIGTAGNPWTQVSLNGLALTTSTDYTVRFVSDATTGNIGANIDNIQLSAVAAVPEPQTYAMFLAGLGLLGFASRKRKA